MAIVLSAARVLLPQVQEYKADVVSQLGRFIGNPVKVGQVGARMHGFYPELVFHETEILDSSGERVLLRFEQMRARFNLQELIFDGQFKPHAITIIGAELSVRRELDGEISIVGLDAEAETPRWLFEDGLFEVLHSDVQWQDLKAHGVKQYFTAVDIRLLNAADRHKVAIDLSLPEAFGSSLSIRMDYSGDIFVPDCCSGQLYVEGKQVVYGRLFEGLSIRGYAIQEGRGDFELWSTWKDSEMFSLGGGLVLRQASLSHTPANDPSSETSVLINHIAGRFLWQVRDDHWRLNIDRFTMALRDQPWPTSAFSIETGHNHEPSVSVTASYARLKDIEQLLDGLAVLDPDMSKVLKILRPDGELYDANFSYAAKDNGPAEFFVCTRVHGFGVSAWKGFPSIENLSGRICGDRAQGEIDVAATDARLDFRPMIRYPVLFNRLDGRIKWSRQGAKLSFSSNLLRANNADVSLRSRFRLDLPENGEPPFLDAQIDFQNGRASAAYRYLPATKLSKSLVSWLDRAILSGQVKQGGVLLRGPMAAFPFEDNSGLFEVLFDAHDVDLFYHAKWPPLYADKVRVLFYQAGTKIDSNSASLLGVPIASVTGWGANLVNDDYFIVEGSARGSIAQSLKIIRQSPLERRFGPLLNVVSLSGRNNVSMKLKIPAAKHLYEFLVDGVVDLNNARLKVADLALTKIEGPINYNQNGMNATGINASLMDFPAKVNIVDLKDRLNAQIFSRIDTDALAARFPGKLWDYVTGAADYRLDLTIPKNTFSLYTDVTLRSDLIGVSVNCPAPLGKEGPTQSNLKLDAHFVEGKNFPIQVQYGEMARADLVYTPTAQGLSAHAGRVALGNAVFPPMPAEGVALKADFPTAKLRPWIKLLSTRNTTKIDPSQNQLQSVELRVRNLLWMDSSLGQGTLNAKQTGDQWTGTIHSDYAAGRFVALKGNHSKMDIDLDFFKIPEFESSDSTADSADGLFVPRAIPSLSLNSQKLIWHGVDYGNFHLQTSPGPKGLNIDSLTLRGGTHALRASGQWTASKSKQFTALSGKMTVNDLGLFLSRAGKANVFKETPVSSDFVLKWHNTPFDISAMTLFGNAEINFGKGRLLKVEPGIGRLFGIFNIDALKSLLLLDFGHLFGKGLAFDGMQSSFHIEGGSAKIKELLIDAIPARISVSGKVDLINKTLDHKVTVVPKGVVALGASVLLNQQLPGTSVDGLISREYSVSGGWEAPKITRLPKVSGVQTGNR